jgi:hypothetical protein
MRLDGTGLGPFAAAPAARPWAEQVWARPLGDGLWRRGRLRPEDDRLVFADEPAATGPERGDGTPPDQEPARTLQRDLLASPMVRSKAATAEVYARLLYLALENATWRHADGTEFEGGQRSTGELVAWVVGAGGYLDWTWSEPSGVLDEEVLADLRTLGWEPVRGEWSWPAPAGETAG